MDIDEWERRLEQRMSPITDSVNEIKVTLIKVGEALTTIAVQAVTLKEHRNLIDENKAEDRSHHDELFNRMRVAESDLKVLNDCKLEKRVDAIENQIKTTMVDILKWALFLIASSAIGGTIAGKITLSGGG